MDLLLPTLLTPPRSISVSVESVSIWEEGQRDLRFDSA